MAKNSLLDSDFIEEGDDDSSAGEREDKWSPPEPVEVEQSKPPRKTVRKSRSRSVTTRRNRIVAVGWLTTSAMANPISPTTMRSGLRQERAEAHSQMTARIHAAASGRRDRP
jgi:hypothetical protein